VEVVGHGHAQAEHQHVASRVGLQEDLGVGFCVAVEGAGEVGGVGFFETAAVGAVLWVLVVVLVDAWDGLVRERLCVLLCQDAVRGV
jgi:hypothetical protein